MRKLRVGMVLQPTHTTWVKMVGESMFKQSKGWDGTNVSW